MDFDKILEISSAQHVSDKSLLHKVKTRSIKFYLGEAQGDDDDDFLEVDDEQPLKTDVDDSSDLDLPFKGNSGEGLKVCLSVALGEASYWPGFDWNRKRHVVEYVWSKSAPSAKETIKKDAREIQSLIRRHEDKENLNSTEKSKVLDFAENFSDLILTILQNEMDSDSEGSSGGKANIARIDNLIPCLFSFKNQHYKGIIAISDPKKNQGMLVWITDKARLEDGKVDIDDEDGSLARILWLQAAKEMNLKDALKKGSVRLIPNTFTVVQEDAEQLSKAGVSFNDTPEAKSFVKRAYIDTVNSLMSSGSLGKRVSKNAERQGDENIAKFLVGWTKVMSSTQFWSKVNI